MQQSFFEKMNEANTGKKGIYIAGATVIAILLIKLILVPILAPLDERPFFNHLKYWNNLVENIALVNILIFFVLIIFYRQGIGGKLLYAMQLKDKTYFQEKWILVWLKTIWISLAILAITTVISQAFFKGWGSFIFLVLLVGIPFYMNYKLKQRFKGLF
jgi:hypothetical protein